MSNKFGSQHVLLRSIYTKSVFTLFLLSLKGKYYFCLFVCQQFLQLLSLSLSLNTSWIPRKEQLGSEPSESWGIRAHFDEETETEGKRGRGRKTRTHTHTHTERERERASPKKVTKRSTTQFYGPHFYQWQGHAGQWIMTVLMWKVVYRDQRCTCTCVHQGNYDS